METIDFNPFEDRLSRDIRNDLSEAFVSAIELGNRSALDATYTNYNDQDIASPYKTYIYNRMSCYKSALAAIEPAVIDPISQAVILWDLGLFFEVHEILEHAWYDAAGEHKMILQALIRSAGVYIKLEHGFTQAAQNIAKKALPVLIKNSQTLQSYLEVQALISALQNLENKPPKLAKKES